MQLVRKRLPVLSRSACLAGRDDTGRGLLRGYEKLPPRRNLRNDCADSPGGSIDPSQYSGGPRSREHRLLHSVSADRAGLDKGAGNSPSSGATRGALGAGQAGTTAEPNGGDREDASFAHSGAAAERGAAVSRLLATRYSLFLLRVTRLLATRHSLFALRLAKRPAAPGTLA